jgi:prepilin-type processing-associated H-X9-DG protein
MTEQLTPMPWVLLPQMGVNASRLEANCNTSEEYAGVVGRFPTLLAFTCPDGPRSYPFTNEPIVYVESDESGYASWWSANIDYVTNAGVLGFARDDTSRRWLCGRILGVRGSDRMVLLADGATDSPRSVVNSWLPAAEDEVTMADLLPASPRRDRVGGKPLAPTRHRNSANVLFADGHVERLSLEPTSLRSAVLMTGATP